MADMQLPVHRLYAFYVSFVKVLLSVLQWKYLNPSVFFVSTVVYINCIISFL